MWPVNGLKPVKCAMRTWVTFGRRVSCVLTQVMWDHGEVLVLTTYRYGEVSPCAAGIAESPAVGLVCLGIDMCVCLHALSIALDCPAATLPHRKPESLVARTWSL